MSSVQQGSNDERGFRRLKGKRGGRRCWTPHEEAVLLTSLKELVALGWKSDNGFKTSYLPRLEEAMQREFLGNDLKGTPHITFKASNVEEELLLPHFGFGSTRRRLQPRWKSQIDCTQEQWEQIVKADANAKTMRYKSWPLFNARKEIFGKDRAIGDDAEDVVDMATDMNQKAEQGDKFANGDDVYRPNLENIFADDVGETSTTNSKKEENEVRHKFSLLLL